MLEVEGVVELWLCGEGRLDGRILLLELGSSVFLDAQRVSDMGSVYFSHHSPSVCLSVLDEVSCSEMNEEREGGVVRSHLGL